jgi:hypothetical protein
VDGTYCPKIPNGTFKCTIGTHKLKDGCPRQLYELMGVPKHTGVLFHIGNTNDDSEGCILLGTYLGTEEVCASKLAFDHFMALQAGLDFTLTVL